MSEDDREMIEQEFERQFGLHGVRAEYSLYIPHQVNLKVRLPVEPTPEMKALGRAIEAGATWFLTTDRALLRKTKADDRLNVADPVDFIRYLQGSDDEN